MPLDSAIAEILHQDPLLHLNYGDEYLDTLPAQTFLFCVDNSAKNTIILSLNPVHSDWDNAKLQRYSFYISFKDHRLHMTSPDLPNQTFMSLTEIVAALSEQLARPLLNKDVPQKIKIHPYYHPTLFRTEAKALLEKEPPGSSLFFPSFRPGCIELIFTHLTGNELNYFHRRFLITIDNRLEYLIRNKDQRIFFNNLDEIVIRFNLKNPIKFTLSSFQSHPEYIIKRPEKNFGPFEKLPEPIQKEIFQWLDFSTLQETKLVNKSWYFFSKAQMATLTIYEIPQVELTKQLLVKKILSILTSQKFQELSCYNPIECSINAREIFLNCDKPFVPTDVQCKLYKLSQDLESSVDKIIKIDMTGENDSGQVELGYLQFTVKDHKFSFAHSLDYWKGLSENWLLDKILPLLQNFERLIPKPILDNEVSHVAMLK